MTIRPRDLLNSGALLMALCASQSAYASANHYGITALTTVQLRAALPLGFDPAIWAEDPTINNGLPYLIANPPPQ